MLFRSLGLAVGAALGVRLGLAVGGWLVGRGIPCGLLVGGFKVNCLILPCSCGILRSFLLTFGLSAFCAFVDCWFVTPVEASRRLPEIE